MFRSILAAFDKAPDRLSVARDFHQKGTRFHKITPFDDVGTTKALKKNRTRSPVT